MDCCHRPVYHCVGWHFYSDPDAVTQGVFPLPGRQEGWALERNFWKGRFGLALPLLHSPEHCVPRRAEEHEGGAGVGDAPGSHKSAEPSPASAPTLSPVISIPTEA